MICPLCNGRKKILKPCDDGFGNALVTCYACNGTGEVTMTNTAYIPKQPMTNYDWLNSLPIEEQAEAMANLVFRATGEYNRERYPSNRWFKKEYWLEWLKQPHRKE